MALPRRPLKHLRRAIMRMLRHRFPAVQKRREAERAARHGRDIERLRGIADSRPDLKIQITCSGRLDGAGGQALSVISALAFADHHHCRYLHTSFRGIAHVEGDPESWTRRWEVFFGFGQGETPVPADAEIMPVRRFVRLYRRDPSYIPGPRVVVQAGSFGYSEFSKSDMTRLTPRLRAKYNSRDKSAIRLHRAPGAINVAIHVRRGDVREGFFRYMPDAPILHTIAQLRAAFDSLGLAAALNVYSEGAVDNFQPYSEAGCLLHLSTDTFETFHNMVSADVLVPAPSAFSWTAALLSDAIVLAPDLSWGIRDLWLTRSPDGAFDQARLVDMLAAKLEAVTTTEVRFRSVPGTGVMFTSGGEGVE
jgi:hypothetical protein